jgi:hypothetical protein
MALDRRRLMEFTMIKIKHLILAGVVGLALSKLGLAQETGAKPSGEPPTGSGAVVDALAKEGLLEPLPDAGAIGETPVILPGIPRPPDFPGSLFAPAQPRSTAPMQMDAPYFVPDPLLDFSPSAPPGWFAGAEVQIVKPHLLPQLSNSVLPGKFVNNTPNSNTLGGNSTIVNLPSAALDWTAAPRVFAGYRLPSGFGDFLVAYRHLGTDGSGSTPGANGPVSLNSRFAFDMIDLDYNSRELSLWPQWDMKWGIGLRSVFLFFDTQGNQPSSQAPAGGVLQAREFNNFFGLGPHAVLQLERHLGESRWSLYARSDFATTFDWVTNGWQTSSSTLGPSGRPLMGETRVFGHQAAPMITGQLGLTWKPAPSSGTRLFVGYQYEVMWDLNRVPQSNGTANVPGSMGQFWDQGIVLQATFRW